MSNTQTKLKEFIEKLAIDSEKKNELLEKFTKPDGEQEVKEELGAILQLAATEFQKKVEVRKKAFDEAMKALETAEEEFKKDMANMEKEAKDLANAISQAEDTDELAKVRGAINS